MPKKKSVVKLRSGDAPVPAAQGSSIPQKDTVSRIKKPKPNGEKQDKQQLGDKGKKRSQQSLPDEAPITKKARKIHTSSEASGSGGGKSQRVEKKSDGKPEARPKPKQPKCSAARNAASAIPEPKPKPRKARPRSPSPSTSSSRSASPEPQVQTPPNPELDPELCGMLIECMATSRASSLPMSTLYKSLMQSYPSLKSRGTEGECLDILERVLENGTVANGGSGVFGKVQSSGHDDSDRPLEAQWFYVPERDQDQERAVLIRSMMPRPAKRSETKKFKQYYYRPLGKISRWDPEDEL
ncbi:hypothetical protein C8J57DRAFT_1041890 [Mycena rebaudengoi]|nr:hypothetical protein C8J57DRAFT_1041890 [Mycena rebaudengoi]